MAETAQAMAGELVAGDGARSFDGAALDSREVEPEQLFFALEGERTDGHRFVADAGRRGAAAAVVHRGEVETASPAGAPELGLIRVEDTYAGLHALTRHVRRRVPTEGLVAITGSAGKTSTKEILAELLGCCFRVARNPGNLNNLYGFPLSLLNVPDDTAWMVAEMGMSSPGELGRIARLGRPDVAVYTNVRPAHLEFFDSVRDIAEAKAELLDGLVPGGVVVANAADAEVVRIVERHRRRRDPEVRLVWYRLEGEGDADSPEGTWSLRQVEAVILPARGSETRSADLGGGNLPVSGGRPGYRFLLAGPAASMTMELPLHGRHNLENFLAAAATAATLGVDLEEIAAAAAGLEPASKRGRVHHLAGGVTLIDDSYNSNPAALTRALEGAAELAEVELAQVDPAERRHWAVLGDMLELGEEAGEYHRRGGREAAEAGFSPVAGVGELSRDLVEAARGAGAEGRWFESAEEAARWAAGELADGDLVLVKGSRGIGLEAVVERLLESRPAPAGEGGAGGPGDADGGDA